MDSIIRLLTPKKMTSYMEDDLTVRQALEKFDVHKFSIVPIIDEKGQYIGTLSEGDLLRFIKNKADYDIKVLERTRVKEIDHYRPYQAVKIDALMLEVFALALDQNFVPVIDDKGSYIGIIKRKDIIRYLSENREIIKKEQ